MADSESTTGRAPAFQFYPADFIAGTVTFTTEEIGAYMLLMCYCWDKGSIPADLKLVARIARMTPPRMRQMWPALVSKFQTVEGGYIQPRIERERQKQAEYRQKQADKAAKRWHSHGNATASVRHVPEPSRKDALQSSSSSSSSDFSQERARPRPVMGGGAGVGSNPRDHLYCRGNGTRCARICVSEKQHGILRAKFGGDDRTSDDALDAFYAEVRSKLDPNQPIGDTPWKFWEAQFAAKFGTVAQVNPKTAGNRAAVERFIARGQQ